ncbi:MAG TPA: UDP-glucose 4-epimerase GalE [Terriglobales bacterium]|nr:UDP-glucose 4-epimerase GalE [Terriglobales bacterium]
MSTVTDGLTTFAYTSGMKVLVIGGAGYIGSHAARILRRHGHDVIIYDNLSTGHEFLAKGFELVVGDIADQDKLGRELSRVEAVMHFAAHAYVGESTANPRKYFRNNVEGALTLLNATLDAGIKKFVFSSTCAVYGTPAKVPITEDTPRQPINPYGVTKLFMENALEAYDRAYGLRFAALRYFNAAGADESGEIGEVHTPETHLIPLALGATKKDFQPLQIFGTDYPTADGTCIRDYIHVNDLGEAHALALGRLAEEQPSFAANLGTGQGYSVFEILKAVEQATGSPVHRKEVPRRAGDPPELVANPARAQKLLGWKATRSLKDIVTTAWKWMQKNESR